MTLIWTDNAKEDYAELLLYVEAQYGLNAAIKLFDKVEKTITTIAAFPKIFPFSAALNGRKAVVTKQTTIIYLIADKKIFIVRLADSRMV